VGAADKTPGQCTTDKKSMNTDINQHQYRDPHEIFREFFGGREPFVDSFFNESGKSILQGFIADLVI